MDPRGLPAPEKIWIEGKSRCGRTTSSRRGPESTGGKRTASTRRSGSNPVGEARRAPPVTGPAIPAPRSFSGGTPRNPRGRAVSRSGRRLRAIVPGPDRHSSRGSAGPSDPCTGFEIETESFRDKAQASSDVAKGTSDPRPAISQSLRRRLRARRELAGGTIFGPCEPGGADEANHPRGGRLGPRRSSRELREPCVPCFPPLLSVG